MARISGPAGPGYRTAALAAALGLGIATVAADARADDSGWYFGMQMPIMFIDDTESKTKGTSLDPTPGSSVIIPYQATATSEYDAGFKLAGVVGYEFGDGLRVEGELFFARAKVDKVTYKGVRYGGTPVPIEVDIPTTGSAKQTGAFASAWYDFHTGTDWIPYFGAGIGFIRVDQSDLEYDDNRLAEQTATALARAAALAQGQDPTTVLPVTLLPGYVPGISRKDTTFAYHIGVGIGYRLNEKTTLQFGYRLQNGNDLEFSGRNMTGTVNVDTEMRVHLFEIGFRTRF